MSDVKKNRSKDIKKIMDAIDPGELSELAVKLGNIPSPCGFEKDVGEFICQWLKEAGFIAFKHQVVEDRFNVVAI